MRRAMEGCELVVNFAAESHVDRSIAGQDPFAVTHVIGTGVLLDAARELGRRALPPGLDRRGLRVDRVRLVHRGVAAQAVVALLGDQGGRRPARPGARAHARDRGGHLPRVEQLRPAPVPGEADPAVHPERAARRPAAGLRRRPPGAQLALRRGLRARDRPRAARGHAGRGLQRRRPRRGGEPPRRRADPRADRARRVADRARRGPQGPRPPLLALVRQGPRARAGSRASRSPRASSGPSPGTATTSGGGRRSAPASTATTTSASTAGGSRERRARAAEADEALRRRHARARGLRPRDRGRRVLRPARAQRRRQDDRDQRRLQPDPDHERRGARLRPPGAHARGQARRRPRRAGRQPRPLPDRAARRSSTTAATSACRARTRARARTR